MDDAEEVTTGDGCMRFSFWSCHDSELVLGETLLTLEEQKSATAKVDATEQQNGARQIFIQPCKLGGRVCTKSGRDRA